MTEQDRLNELIDLIQQWGRDRKIIQNGTYEGQWLKLVSEIGEMADNLAKGKSIEDDIGDCFVVVCMMAGIIGYEIETPIDVINPVFDVEDTYTEFNWLYHNAEWGYPTEDSRIVLESVVSNLDAVAQSQNLDLVQCVETAYNEIKHRGGELLPNGVFVKREE